MKLVSHFDGFLKDTVNLNQTRIDTLEERVTAIETFLKNSDYEPMIRSFSKQGSWAHKTIIRPPTGKEFDADLAVYVYPVEDWNARDYLVDLRRVFLASKRYEKITILKTRCVRINYAGDFHLDVVPIVVQRDPKTAVITGYWACNRTDKVFEPSDGDGYATWWNEQNTLARGQLKKVVRLLKCLRDIKGTFSVKSVLFTTVVGERITAIDQFLPNKFADVPTALKTVVGRLDDWLQEHERMPDIDNPALDGESFTRHWDQDLYDTFRDKIHNYREWIDDAYEDSDRDESLRKWQRVFGKDFAKGETVDRASTVVAQLAQRFLPGHDLVAAVLYRGGWVLDNMPSNFLHVEPPPRMSGKSVPVGVIAHEKRTEGGPIVRQLQSREPIDPVSGIEFQAVNNAGKMFSKDYKVRWQVANTDQEAIDDNALRGEFYRSDKHCIRYERTKYRGVHWVQAFLINRGTGLCDGVSERFFVVIP